MADPTEDEGDDHTESSVIRDLRAKAKRAEEAETRARQAERELGLHKAGLSHLDEDQVAALVGSGEFDVDAVKAKAEKWGWTNQTPAPEPAPAPAAADLSQMEQFGAGGSTSEPPPSARAVFEKELAEFNGSAAEYDEFVRRNMEFLT